MEHAHELPEWLHFLEEIEILRGFVFGFAHTLIPLIGFYTGWSINRLLKLVSNGYVAGILGVVLAHVIADFIAPTPKARSLFPADFIIWVDTIKEGRFDDTNQMFVKPKTFDYHVTTQDAKNWALKIIEEIKK